MNIIKEHIDNLNRVSSNISYRCMADIKAEPIDWLWCNRIAKGKITIIAGDPGLGKSQLTAFMAATVTNGLVWPVENMTCPKGNVIFLSAEDDAADTIRPRLEAAGANLSRIYILDAVRAENKAINKDDDSERGLDLKQDIQKLDTFISEVGGAALIVIDPITAYLGGVDSHKNADVRALLSPLSSLAARHKTAIIGITHFNKGQSKQAMQRVTGSFAFVAAARASYVVIKDQEAPERRLFLPIKNNIGNDQTGFAFSIQSVILDNQITTSRLVFEDKLISDCADTVLSRESDLEGPRALDDACDFLRIELTEFGKSAKIIKKRALDAGISDRTLRRAKEKLRVTSKKEGQEWKWIISHSLEDVQDGHENSLGTMATLPSSREVIPCKD